MIYFQDELELRFPASTLTDQNVFSFIIVASDNGKPKQTSIANVKVLYNYELFLESRRHSAILFNESHLFQVFVVKGGKKGGFFPIASSASTSSLINPIPTSLTSLSTPNSSESSEIETTTQEIKKETTKVREEEI